MSLDEALEQWRPKELESPRIPQYDGFIQDLTVLSERSGELEAAIWEVEAPKAPTPANNLAQPLAAPKVAERPRPAPLRAPQVVAPRQQTQRPEPKVEAKRPEPETLIERRRSPGRRASDRQRGVPVGLVVGAILGGMCMWGLSAGGPAAFSWLEKLDGGSSVPLRAPPAPPLPSASESALANPSTPDTTAESDRLTNLLGHVPSLAVPEMLHNANRDLSQHGEPSCAVESAQGEISVVIVSGQNFPLARALKRCADALERVMGNP